MPSVPYVRFDGQMSAQRRQAAIARFSVPLAAEFVEAGEVIPRKRAIKMGRSISDEFGPNSDNNAESDFVVDDDDNDEFDDPALHFRQEMTRSKGKRKAVQKKQLAFDASDENPKVMLLSLKAVSRNSRGNHYY